MRGDLRLKKFVLRFGVMLNANKEDKLKDQLAFDKEQPGDSNLSRNLSNIISC